MQNAIEYFFTTQSSGGNIETKYPSCSDVAKHPLVGADTAEETNEELI